MAPLVRRSARTRSQARSRTVVGLTSDPAVRPAQVADMAAIMARRRGPKLLLGDFNAEPDASELVPLWARLSDALSVAGKRTTPTWPADAPVKRIDHITFTPSPRVTGAFVPDTLASDHRPVVADLRGIRS
jgi:endonuclease/exonuclease/phosphatase family metal-dependent hydrolase